MIARCVRTGSPGLRCKLTARRPGPGRSRCCSAAPVPLYPAERRVGCPGTLRSFPELPELLRGNQKASRRMLRYTCNSRLPGRCSHAIVPSKFFMSREVSTSLGQRARCREKLYRSIHSSNVCKAINITIEMVEARSISKNKA